MDRVASKIVLSKFAMCSTGRIITGVKMVRDKSRGESRDKKKRRRCKWTFEVHFRVRKVVLEFRLENQFQAVTVDKRVLKFGSIPKERAKEEPCDIVGKEI